MKWQTYDYAAYLAGGSLHAYYESGVYRSLVPTRYPLLADWPSPSSTC